MVKSKLKEYQMIELTPISGLEHHNQHKHDYLSVATDPSIFFYLHGQENHSSSLPLFFYVKFQPDVTNFMKLVKSKKFETRKKKTSTWLYIGQQRTKDNILICK